MTSLLAKVQKHQKALHLQFDLRFGRYVPPSSTNISGQLCQTFWCHCLMFFLQKKLFPRNRINIADFNLTCSRNALDCEWDPRVHKPNNNLFSKCPHSFPRRGLFLSKHRIIIKRQEIVSLVGELVLPLLSETAMQWDNESQTMKPCIGGWGSSLWCVSKGAKQCCTARSCALRTASAGQDGGGGGGTLLMYGVQLWEEDDAWRVWLNRSVCNCKYGVCSWGFFWCGCKETALSWNNTRLFYLFSNLTMEITDPFPAELVLQSSPFAPPFFGHPRGVTLCRGVDGCGWESRVAGMLPSSAANGLPLERARTVKMGMVFFWHRSGTIKTPM